MKKILLLSIILLTHHFTYSKPSIFKCIQTINNTKKGSPTPNLEDANLKGCMLNSFFIPSKTVNFQNAHLEETKISVLNLMNADFSNAIFSSPTSTGLTALTNCTFTNTKFDGAKMANTIFSNCTFYGCSFNGCSFNENNKKPTAFMGCNFHNYNEITNKFSNINDGQKVQLSNSIVHGTLAIDKCIFNNADLTQLNAENIIITDSIIDNSNFTMTVIDDAKNEDPPPPSPHITNLTITNGSAKNLIFESVVIGNGTGTIASNATGAIFENTDLSATSFKNSIMKKTLFSAPVLGANFENTDLTDSIVDLNCYKTFNSLWFATIEKDKKPTHPSLTSVTSVNPRGEVYTKTQVNNIVERISPKDEK